MLNLTYLLDLEASSREPISGAKEKDKEAKIEIHQGELYQGQRCLISKFSWMEYVVMKLMIEKEGRLVTKDEISDVLWGEECLDRYSEGAIARLIGRLRKKLKSLDLPEDSIKTIYGRGYTLVW